MATILGCQKKTDLDIEKIFEDLLPTKETKMKRNAQILKEVFQDAERAYFSSFANQTNYETAESDKLSEPDQNFVIQTMYKSWFVRSPIYNQLRVRSEYCAYCYVDFVSELDHYYSKEKYPEVAILPVNLIPSCADCNRKKSEKTGYVQPYFEDVSQYQWLRIELVYEDKGNKPVPVFSLEKPSKMPRSLFKKLKSQLKNTLFIVKITQSATDEILTYWDVWKNLAMGNENLTSFTDFIVGTIVSFKNTFGINYWKVLLYQAILADMKKILRIWELEI